MAKLEFVSAIPEDFESSDVTPRTLLSKPSDLNPLEVYLGLKRLFGEPDRTFIDEDKQQWVFLLKTTDSRIEVYDWKLDSWSIAVYQKDNDEQRARKIVDELLKQIKKSFSQQRATAAALLKNPQGHVIENPFALYYQTANELVDLAEQLQSHEIEFFGPFPTLRWSEAQYTLCRSAFFQYVAAMEGLLNLIYEIYLRPELREDRIADRLSREQIDVKLRLAPVYCDCFRDKPIDHTTDAFKNFHTLANARNNFIHANLTKAMRTPLVVHEGASYLIRHAKINGKLPNSFRDVGIEEIRKVRDSISDIVDQVLAHMKPRYRREFSSVMHDGHIRIEYEDGVPVIER